MSNPLSDLISGLIKAGTDPSVIGAVLGGVSTHVSSNNSAAQTVHALLQQAQMLVMDSGALQAIATQIQITPGVPLQILPLVGALKTAVANPVLLAEICSQIEATLNSTTSTTSLAAMLANMGKSLTTTTTTTQVTATAPSA